MPVLADTPFTSTLICILVHVDVVNYGPCCEWSSRRDEQRNVCKRDSVRGLNQHCSWQVVSSSYPTSGFPSATKQRGLAGPGRIGRSRIACNFTTLLPASTHSLSRHFCCSVCDIRVRRLRELSSVCVLQLDLEAAQALLPACLLDCHWGLRRKG